MKEALKCIINLNFMLYRIFALCFTVKGKLTISHD